MRNVISFTQRAVELSKALPPKPAKTETLPTGAHRTPPKGYPTNKADYAIPSEYKYPLDTEKHVRAAISYFSIPKNAGQYSKDEQKSIWSRIKKAAKRMKIELGEDTGKVKKSLDAAVAEIDSLLK